MGIIPNKTLKESATPVTHVDPTTDTSTSNSYTKQVWTDGDVITAEKLNHMEDGIANGGATTTPDWDENDSTSSSYIANRPFYSVPYLDEYIFSTENKITFTYIEDSQNGNHYLGTYTIDEIDSIDYSNTTFGIEISQNQKIFSKYDMFSPTENIFTTYSYPKVGIQRTTSNSSTQYEIRFMSENIGDTVEAYVDFGTIGENIIPIEQKYLGTNGIVRVRLANNNSTITLSGDNSFTSLDELSSYLASGGYVYLEYAHDIYTMTNNRGIYTGSDYIVTFTNDNGIFEYNRNTNVFTLYEYSSNINNENNVDTCSTPFNKLTYVKQIYDSVTGITMPFTRNEYSATPKKYYQGIRVNQDGGITPTIEVASCIIDSNNQVTMTRKEYSLTEVTT